MEWPSQRLQQFLPHAEEPVPGAVWPLGPSFTFTSSSSSSPSHLSKITGFVSDSSGVPKSTVSARDGSRRLTRGQTVRGRGGGRHSPPTRPAFSPGPVPNPALTPVVRLRHRRPPACSVTPWDCGILEVRVLWETGGLSWEDLVLQRRPTWQLHANVPSAQRVHADPFRHLHYLHCVRVLLSFLSKTRAAGGTQRIR